ncbi:putative bifunctional diguanylate cyclase/phosphodiesterase [Sphingomonas montana]|uniref:putative bifunctional diguanylate cyclase/phosphodiesterase n=1 Tax=Sphingomonas montana TaxID=1843236 RepID=UPI00096D5B8D|nr:EAL domain-containing protein [Sphingomonas montana]
MFELFRLRSRTPPSDAFLLEQYATLRRQIPLMYALMFINVLFLGIATFHDVPLGMSFGIPVALSIVIAVRALLWFRRRTIVAAPADIQRYLRGTLITAGLLSAIFGGWGSLLFSEQDPVRSAAIALYVFVGAMSCCFCMQALPRAGHLILLLGVMPVTVRLLVSSDWSLFTVGTNFLVVAALILRTLTTSHTGFKQVLETRSGMIAEQERARAAERIAQDLAYRDPLTGLRNRRALSERLDQFVASRQPTQLCLFMLDLDRFKEINDSHGHGAGDRLLQAVASRLIAIVGDLGHAYRLGGDEFAVTIETAPDGSFASTAMADRMVQDMAAPFLIHGFTHHISASIGISIFPADAISREMLMQHADIAMYDAKSLGRSRYSSFEPAMAAKLAARAVLEREMRVDLPANAFQPHYQPIVSLASGSIVGFEMLARWNRTDGATVGPAEFIPIVEECGLIGELTLKLLDQVCIDAADWPNDLTIAINVSPIQFRDPWFSEKILAVLTRRVFPSRRISLEITENALISDPIAAQRIIESLKNQGMALALDDFGTGYSSLQHLRMLPFDKLKIDRSFVRNVDRDDGAYQMVSAIIRLADSLKLSVVAEGVESLSVCQTLQRLGCREAQGYLFGKAMSAVDTNLLLHSSRYRWPTAPPGPGHSLLATAPEPATLVRESRLTG